MLKSNVNRFYKSAEVRHEPNGSAILLDGKPIKTPAGHSFIAPTRALAEAIAEEWRTQGERIVPDTMPLTKSLNTVIDRIAPHREAIIDELAKYAGSDLLCYRAAEPAELVRRQSAAWDPWLEWSKRRFGAHLVVVTGMRPVDQPREVLDRLRDAIAAHDDHRLVALHTGITITGSAVLGLAFAARAALPTDIFAAAQVDEIYQAERWGRDAEAEALWARRNAELVAGRRFLDLLD